MNKRIKQVIYPIHNEVIPQRAYPALLELSPFFEIVGFAGRADKKSITKRLISEIKKREGYKTEWRSRYTENEIKSLHLMKDSIKQGMPYFEVNENNTLPKQLYESCDAVFIGTNNLTHIPYALDAFKNNCSFILEKPAFVKEKEIKIAESITNLIDYQNNKNSNKGRLIQKVSCHYIHKPACLGLREIISELTDKYGKIKSLESYIEETDDPKKPRTLSTLNPEKSGGGIYFDTVCHLESFVVSILKGKLDMEEFNYDTYQGYASETYVNAKYNVNQGFFEDNAKARFSCGKFIKDERKEAILYFKNEFKAEILFGKGRIKIKNKDKIIKEYDFNEKYSSNEYVNIFKNFYESFINRKELFTNFKEIFEMTKKMIKNYKNNYLSGNRIKKY